MDILHPIEAEKGVIVGILSGHAEHMKTADVLSAYDFSDITAMRIFEACKALWTQHSHLELMSLDEELTRMYGQQAAAEMMQFVLEAMRGGMLHSWQTPQFVAAVQEASIRRKLVSIGEKLSAGAADPQCDYIETSDTARTELRKSVKSDGSWFSAVDAVMAAYDAAEHREKPISTGIAELDMIMCGGLHKGEFSLIGARPAVGKSAMLLSIALEAAKNGINVAFASLEMSQLQLGTRILSAKSGFNAALLRSGEEMPKDAWTDLADALLEIDGESIQRISFMVNGALTVEQLRQEVQSMVDNGKCDLLILDYLQLLNTKRKVNSELERLETVSRALKSITLDCNVALLAAAQLRRQNNGGILRAPSLDELRGSGSLEQDADNVILMHRPESSEDEILQSRSYERIAGAFERGKAEGMQLISLDVCKQRQGRTARAWTLFDGAHMRYINPTEV